jgi:type I restriction enzyme S subunit
MKRQKLIDIAPFSGQRVKPFDGIKRYMSTGDLQGDSLSFEEVTFEDKPSRADIEVNEGDILFAKMTNTNKALKIDKEHDGIIVSTGFSVHRPIEDILNGDYLLHFLKHDSFQRQKNKLCTGAIQSAISNKGIAKIFVPITEYKEQVQIANFLSKAENLINQRKESIELLDEYLKSTFLEMFGDPAFNSKKWNKVKFKSLISEGDKINYGIVQPGPDGNKEGVAVIRVGDFDGIRINTTNLKLVDPNIEQKHKASRLVGDEVLIACVGATIGKIALTDRTHAGMNIVRAIARIRCNPQKLNRLYLCYLLLTGFYQFNLKNLARNIAQPTLNIGQIEELKIIVPPLELQDQFAQIVEKTEIIQNQYLQSMQELENLYGSLSQKAFNEELNLS